MDATKIKVGDKVRLRNGETYTVTEVVVTRDDLYPVEITWEVHFGDEDCWAYTTSGTFWTDRDDPLDILEILPSGSNSEESAPESVNDPYQDDIVVRPSHYTQFSIEPVTFVMENDLPFHVGNIIKYACRAGSKLYPGMDARESEKTDLEKVRRYAEMRINQLEGEAIL